jgi:hypothetical protein
LAFSGARFYIVIVESVGLSAPKLATKLGEAAHVSPLLRRALQISGCEADTVGEWLLKCAVERGAAHYERNFRKDLPADSADLTDEEVGVALCLGEHPYNAAFIRAAAQLLSSARINQRRLARLAETERVEPVLLYIAGVAARFNPGASPWSYLLERLRHRRVIQVDALPHWSRFVSQTGMAGPRGGPEIKWLWRREPSA